jgi:hypothetical protein
MGEFEKSLKKRRADMMSDIELKEISGRKTFEFEALKLMRMREELDNEERRRKLTWEKWER